MDRADAQENKRDVKKTSWFTVTNLKNLEDANERAPGNSSLNRSRQSSAESLNVDLN